MRLGEGRQPLVMKVPALLLGPAAVQYVDSIIDPSGDAPLADVDVADAFLAKLDRRPGSTETLQVIELREAAQRFS